MPEKKIDPEKFWRNWFTADAFSVEMGMVRMFGMLPSDRRCRICFSPFEGAGGFVMSSVFGRKRSSLNQYFCNACEEFAHNHPGGAEVNMSMLFADVRGSTALSESMTALEFQN
jgi:adenylate cyclase